MFVTKDFATGFLTSGCTARSGRMTFLAGWLLQSIRLAAALGFALMTMQAPAVTREYQAALLQLVRSSEQEIAQRRASPSSTGWDVCAPKLTWKRYFRAHWIWYAALAWTGFGRACDGVFRRPAAAKPSAPLLI